MDVLVAVALAWVLVRCWAAVEAEFTHDRGRHAKEVAKAHPNWSPRRVGRHATARALSRSARSWPVFRDAWKANWAAARADVEEARADSEAAMRGARERLERARQRRQDARGKEGGEPGEGTTPEPWPTTFRAPAPVIAGPGIAEPPEPELCEVCHTPGTDRFPLVDHDGCRMHATHIKIPVPPPVEPEDTDPPPEPSPDEPSDWSTPFPDEPPGAVPGPSADHEGAPMADDNRDIESGGDTPYESLLTYHDGRAQAAADRAKTAQDELTAYAITHGFDRDKEYMAQVQAIIDAEEASAASEKACKEGLVSRHSDGDEYHKTGQDAHATAFRPA